MGERRFAGTWPRAATDERRHACRVMRCAERPIAADTPAGQVAGKAPDHAHFEHLGGRERRQDRGQPPRQHRLAGARWADHEEMMPAGRGHFERPLRGLLALDVLEVGHRLIARVRRRCRASQGLQAFEVVDELEQVGWRQDRHVGGGPRGFRPHGPGQMRPFRSASRRSPPAARRRRPRSSRRARALRARNSLRWRPARSRPSPP